MNFFSSRAKFEKLLNEIKPDVVHIRSRWPALCFSGIIKKKKFLWLQLIMERIAEITFS